MSTILEALQKARREREANASGPNMLDVVPTGHRPGGPAPRRSGMRWFWVTLLVLSLLVAGVAGGVAYVKFLSPEARKQAAESAGAKGASGNGAANENNGQGVAPGTTVMVPMQATIDPNTGQQIFVPTGGAVGPGNIPTQQVNQWGGAVAGNAPGSPARSPSELPPPVPMSQIGDKSLPPPPVPGDITLSRTGAATPTVTESASSGAPSGPTQRVKNGVSLGAILRDNNMRIAIINGIMMHEGETRNGVTLVKVEPTVATVRTANGETFELSTLD